MIAYVNSAFCAMLGYDNPGRLIGQLDGSGAVGPQQGSD